VNKDHTRETKLVVFVPNWPFEDLETWSLLRGGLYSEVVFQAGLTVFKTMKARSVLMVYSNYKITKN